MGALEAARDVAQGGVLLALPALRVRQINGFRLIISGCV